MSFSSGVFSINTAGQPVVTGTVISSTAFNALTADLATGLSTCLLKDGSQTLTANIPMGAFKLTGLAAGTTAGDSVRYEQIGSLSQTSAYLTGVAGTNTVTGTATPTPSLAVGQRYIFIPAVTNTGATTLNISSTGAGAVQWAGGALTGGELVAGTPVEVLVTAATPVYEIINETQFPDTRALVVGGTDATKKIRFEVDGSTTATTRVLTTPDQDSGIGIVLSTEQASTSGTSIDFTGIPTWVKRITVMFSGVSISGTSDIIIQLGDSGGPENAGYLGASTLLGAGASSTNYTTGFGFVMGNAAFVLHGSIILTLENSASFRWAASGVMALSNTTGTITTAGVKATSAALDRVRITTANGTDTFDAGVINILYE